MSLTLPDELAEVMDFLGFHWPQADEDKIFECSRSWKDYAGEVEHVIADAERACREAIDRNRGESITAFEGHWRELGGDGDLRRAADAAGVVSEALELFGDAVIAMKTATLVQLGITAGAVIASVASAIFTAGLSTLAGGAAVQAGRIAIRKIIEELIEKLVKSIIPKLKHEALEIFKKMVQRLRHYLDELVTKLRQTLRRGHGPVDGTNRAPVMTGCFVTGTMVVTVDGLQPIENLVAGDKVVAVDPITATQQVYPITATFIHTVPVVLDLCVRGTRITCSPAHPLWISGVGWCDAGTLHAGDTLLTQEGRPTQIDSVDRHQGAFTVYNIEVAGIHTYCVSELGVIAHNKAASRSFKKPKKGAKGKEGATDAKSLAKGRRPYQGESGKDYAKRLMDEDYGQGGWKDTGPGSEYNQLKKYGDRHFE